MNDQTPKRKPFPHLTCKYCGAKVLSRDIQRHFLNFCTERPARGDDERICSCCQTVQHIDGFSTDSDKPMGKSYTCIACNRMAVSEWRERMGNASRTAAAIPRPSRKAVKYCHYCGAAFAAREIWPHRAVCPKNPKLIKGTIHKCSGEGVTDAYRTRKLAKYNMTPSAYDAMLAAQGGGCKFCGITPPENAHPNQKILAVDHIHGSDPIVIRGLLCTNCNHGVGKLKDNPILMLKAAINCAEFDPTYHYLLPTLRVALANSQPVTD